MMISEVRLSLGMSALCLGVSILTLIKTLQVHNKSIEVLNVALAWFMECKEAEHV